MSTPLFTGSIQLPYFSIDTATTASLGSPFVLNRALPRNNINEKKQTPSNIMMYLSSRVRIYVMVLL